jgi:hypothetical protein
VNVGAIALGGVAGLSAGLVVAVPLLITGVADTGTFAGQAVLILLGFGAQLLAGFVAAAIAGRNHPVNGGLAALALFAVVSAISIATGSDPGGGTLAFSGVVALVLGTAGGVLAHAAAEQRERQAGN